MSDNILDMYKDKTSFLEFVNGRLKGEEPLTTAEYNSFKEKAQQLHCVRDFKKLYAASKQGENPFDADGTGMITSQNIENALAILGISARFNVLSHRLIFEGAGLQGKDPSGYPAIVPTMLREALQGKLKGVTEEKISSTLTNIGYDEINQFNPVLEMIESVQWDGKDRIETLYNLLGISSDDQLSRVLILKWLMQCYCGLYNTLKQPFSLDIVLVLVGSQGFGKTRLLEKLAMKSEFFAEGRSLDPRDKDNRLQITSRWICELGEIGSSMKRDQDLMKAYISQSTDEDRPPYGRTTVTYPRRTSFCGSTNDMQFLVDETGNRRYATIPLSPDKFIDLNSEEFRSFDAPQLWAQVAVKVNATCMAENKTYSSVFRLTREERAQLDERNAIHSKPLKGEREVREILASINQNRDRSDCEVKEEWLTVTEFKTKHLDILRPYSSEQLGKVLQRLGYDSKFKRISGNLARRYLLPCEIWYGYSSRVNSG